MGRRAITRTPIALLAAGAALAGGCGPDDVLRLLPGAGTTAREAADPACVEAWNTTVADALRAEVHRRGFAHAAVRTFAASAAIPPTRTGCAYRFLGPTGSALAIAYLDDGLASWQHGLREAADPGDPANVTLTPDGRLRP